MHFLLHTPFYPLVLESYLIFSNSIFLITEHVYCLMKEHMIINQMKFLYHYEE